MGTVTRRQSRIFDTSHRYWRPTTVTRDEPRLRDVSHCKGQSLYLRKNTDIWKTGVDTVRDFQPLYESFEHGYLLATVRDVQTLYPWLVTGVFFHIPEMTFLTWWESFLTGLPWHWALACGQAVRIPGCRPVPRIYRGTSPASTQFFGYRYME